MTVEAIIDFPTFDFIRPVDSSVGITTAIEEEMKMIPIKSEVAQSNPKKKPILRPTKKGIKEFKIAIGMNSLKWVVKLEKRVSRPPINIRKIRPISPKNSKVASGVKKPNPCGPTIRPPKISATTHGK